MKKYIVFTGTITRMGGAQMYVGNKALFMEANGYEVHVFSGLRGQILIKNLARFEREIIDDLNTFPFFLTQGKQKQILNQVLNLIDYNQEDEIVIESNGTHVAFWAEMLANMTNGKHFLFLLDEYFDESLPCKDFFEFKYRRKELAVIKQQALYSLFGNDIISKNPEEAILVAPCNNVVEDITDEYFDSIDYSIYEYVCCSLGRLNKRYIPNVIDGFKKFALNNSNSKILYIFIGDQPEDWPVNIKREIENTFANIQNVDLKMAGYKMPIAKSFFSNINFGVASAGSNWVFLEENVPNISMDAADGQPIGIFGYDTMQSLYRDNDYKYSLERYMEMILKENYLVGSIPLKYERHTYEEYFRDHLLFLYNSSIVIDYFSVNEFIPRGIKNRIKRLLIKSLGVTNYRKITKTLKSD